MEKKEIDPYKYNKFNFVFMLYFSLSLITIALFVVGIYITTLEFEVAQILFNFVPFNALVLNFFYLSLAYLGVNLGEHFLDKPILSDKEYKEIRKSNKFKRKRYVAWIWFLLGILGNIVLFRSIDFIQTHNTEPLLNIGNLYTYLFTIMAMFLISEQAEKPLCKLDSDKILKTKGE